MNCPTCGAMNEGQAKFCKKCGKALAQAEPVQKAAALSGTGGITGGISGAFAGGGSLHISKPGQLKAGALEVRDKIVRFGDSVMAAKHIEYVSTHVPKPSFPKLALLILIASIILFFVMPPAGAICLVVALVWIGWWRFELMTVKKGVTFYLNSGRSITIFFSDHAFADELVDAVGKALAEEEVVVSLNLPADASVSEQGASGGFAKKLGA